MHLIRKIKKAIFIYSEFGYSGLFRHLRIRRRIQSEKKSYRKWLRTIDRQRYAETAKFARTPLISVIVPVYNIDEKWLRRCIDSVREQTYENWELCIADDRSDRPHIAAVLSEYAGSDPRIKVVFREENGHISAASNTALELAAGEFCVLLDHDDELSKDALYWVVHELNEYHDAQMIYSDEDLLDTRGRRYSPSFKPDFSRDLLYSLNLVTHLSAYRTELLRKIGGFRIGLEGSQDYDLALRVVKQIRADQIRHICKVLYHWRVIEGSVATSPDAKPYAHERARQAIRHHLENLGIKASVTPEEGNLHRVRYEVPVPSPAVSVFLVTPGDRDAEIPEYFSALDYQGKIDVFRVGKDPNLAGQLNEAVESANGSVIVFLCDNLIAANSDWLNELVGFAIQPEIGCVGGKVVNELCDVVSGGLVLGGDEMVNIAHGGYPADAHGNMGRNLVIGNYSAVSLSVMAMQREVFDDIGGFDARNLSQHFLDADICLRLREKGFRIVHSPYALFRCAKSTNRKGRTPSASEIDYFSKKWRNTLAQDPFCNPNLSPDGMFSIRV